MERERKPHDGAAVEHEQEQPAQHDPRAMRWAAIVKSATKWNSAHADLVATFNQLTQGSCAGNHAGVSVSLVRKWQAAHGLPADGKIGPRTLQAAERGNVTFSDKEADPVNGKIPSPDLAAEAVDEGETSGEEHAEPPGDTYEGDTIAGDMIEKAEGGVGSKAAGKVGQAVMLAPHVISLLRKHDYRGALKFVWKAVGQEDRAELLKIVAEKIKGELSEHALAFFEKAAMAGLILDVLELGWEWTKLGLDSIREAHERGDQKARIRIYAYAWSDTIIRGEHNNPGAVTPEEREAMKLGIEDGRATRERQPDLPALLLAQYDGHDSAAREALERKLMQKAGI